MDDIHAIAGDKRGAHLALSLERLEALARRRPQRVGLSATVEPDKIRTRKTQPSGMDRGTIQRSGRRPFAQLRPVGPRPWNSQAEGRRFESGFPLQIFEGVGGDASPSSFWTRSRLSPSKRETEAADVASRPPPRVSSRRSYDVELVA